MEIYWMLTVVFSTGRSTWVSPVKNVMWVQPLVYQYLQHLQCCTVTFYCVIICYNCIRPFIHLSLIAVKVTWELGVSFIEAAYVQIIAQNVRTELFMQNPRFIKQNLMRKKISIFTEAQEKVHTTLWRSLEKARPVVQQSSAGKPAKWPRDSCQYIRFCLEKFNLTFHILHPVTSSNEFQISVIDISYTKCIKISYSHENVAHRCSC